jgi:hypothetical protein
LNFAVDLDQAQTRDRSLIRAAAVGARLQAAPPGAMLPVLPVLPRAGHQILLERPDAVLQAILTP